MPGRFEELDVFITPPTVNGSSLNPKFPEGARCVALTNVASQTNLTGDIFLQRPDGSTVAGVDYKGFVMVRFFADGDDVAILFGNGALTPDPAAVGASAGCCEVIKNGTYVDYLLSPAQHTVLSARAVNTTAKLRYRVSGPLPSVK